MVNPNNLPPSDDSLPLWSFFQDWQRLDRNSGHQSVDLQAYFLLIEALTNGMTFGNRNALFALCKGLLLKPHHSESDFKTHFDAAWSSKIDTIDRTTAKRNKPEQKGNGSKIAGKPNSPITIAEELGGDVLPPTPIKPEMPIDSPKQEAATSKVAVRFGALEANGNETDEDKNWETEANARPFRIQGNYEPLEGRSLRQHIRHLRQQTYRNTSMEFNLNATIDRVTQQGFFNALVYKRNLRYEVPLTLLVDRRGSMVPFNNLSNLLVDAVLEQPGSSVRYFQNSFEKFLFRTPFLTEPEQFNTWKSKVPDRSLLLILSDAGAARGYYNPIRVDQTRKMLELLKSLQIVWLNPMPRERWWATSASNIATQVPMYALDEIEIGTAIKSLNGLMLNNS